MGRLCDVAEVLAESCRGSPQRKGSLEGLTGALGEAFVAKLPKAPGLVG